LILGVTPIIFLALSIRVTLGAINSLKQTLDLFFCS